MSFSEEVKKELAVLQVKNACCRKSLLWGMLLEAEPEEKKSVQVCFKNPTVSELAKELIRLQYVTEAAEETVGKFGRYYHHLRFSSPAASRILSQIREEGADPGTALRFSCESCRASFLRGVFLAVGTVNDPHKSFHLEWDFEKEAAADFLQRFLESVGYSPKRLQRSNGFGVYFKDSGTVEDLIAMMGAHHMIFEIMNNRIEREIRNNENRATNCVARNIGKSVNAALAQIQAIQALRTSGGFHSLPEPLQVTATVREANPDASLEELALLHEPPISKSGLNHRLHNIMEAAKEIGKEGK